MGIDKEGGKGGVVMNIASTAGITCRSKISYALPAYYASKHAVVSLTRCFGVSRLRYFLFSDLSITTIFMVISKICIIFL